MLVYETCGGVCNKHLLKAIKKFCFISAAINIQNPLEIRLLTSCVAGNGAEFCAEKGNPALSIKLHPK